MSRGSDASLFEVTDRNWRLSKPRKAPMGMSLNRLSSKWSSDISLPTPAKAPRTRCSRDTFCSITFSTVSPANAPAWIELTVDPARIRTSLRNRADSLKTGTWRPV